MVALGVAIDAIVEGCLEDDGYGYYLVRPAQDGVIDALAELVKWFDGHIYIVSTCYD